MDELGPSFGANLACGDRRPSRAGIGRFLNLGVGDVV